MSVAVECLVEAEESPEQAFGAVEDEFRRLERIFSRFDPASELSRLNALGSMRCSADLVDVVVLALRARQDTHGRFDPTVHDALVAAGYDRTFRDVPPAGRGMPSEPRPCGGDVRVSLDTGVVTLGPGAALDLGGIVKGYTAERAARLLSAHGPCLVNAAGDIAVRGAPSSGGWTIGVDVPGEPVVLSLARGGVATSGRDYRRWRREGRELHHLIDPLTGLPSASDLLTVTVVAGDAVEAEVRAKALFLAGEAAGAAEADREGWPCLLVTADGRVVTAGGLG
jgi:thiamine biosynthesis lipoprotein